MYSSVDLENDSYSHIKIIIPSWLFHDYMFPIQFKDAARFDQIKRISEQHRFEQSLESVYSIDPRPDQVVIFVPTTVDNYFTGIPIRGGNRESELRKCTIKRCLFTDDLKFLEGSHVILWQDQLTHLDYVRKHTQGHNRARQLWVWSQHESASNTENHLASLDLFNASVTYRLSSTFAHPYVLYVPHAPGTSPGPDAQFDQMIARRSANTSSGGTARLVAWVVSNCDMTDGARQRMEYARELARYVPLDIFGRCGTQACPPSGAGDCFGWLGERYKFYLAFENTHCREYITEKLRNPLM